MSRQLMSVTGILTAQGARRVLLRRTDSPGRVGPVETVLIAETYRNSGGKIHPLLDPTKVVDCIFFLRVSDAPAKSPNTTMPEPATTPPTNVADDNDAVLAMVAEWLRD